MRHTTFPHLRWILAAGACLSIFAGADAAASTLTWPGSPGCTGTLQACINTSGSGDRIEIATNDPIDENLNLGDHSLTLTAQSYVKPSFAPGRSIEGLTSAGLGTVAVTLSKLRLRNGHVTLDYAGPGNATYSVSDLDLVPDGAAAANYIHVQAASGSSTMGTVTATVYNNRIQGTPLSLNSGLIELVATGATLNAYASFNRVVRADAGGSDGAGILVDVKGGFPGLSGAGTLRLFGNEVRGVFNRAGLFFSEGLFSSTPSSFSARAYNNVIVCENQSGNGIGLTASSGSIDSQVVNNTVSDCYDGIAATPWSGGSGPTISGLVWNNLVVAQYGLELVSPVAATMTNDYNLINAGSNSGTLGPHSITAPAKLVSTRLPRLAADSPAIGAADGITLANGIIENSLPTLDADGLRRIKNAGADIGAYESGDVEFEHIASAANTSAHITFIDNPAAGASPASLFPTRAATNAPASTNAPFGVWYASSWTIYHEDTSVNVDAGTRWNVFVPATGGGLFTHVGSASDTSAYATQIDNSATNGVANRIILVRHNYNLDGLYLNHPVGLFYSGSGASGRWNIANSDRSPMPVGAGFNVYAQPASPNAFLVHVATGANGERIDHPLINGVPCAQPQASLVFDPVSPALASDFHLDYNSSSGYWYVYTSTAFPGGVGFNIVIDPAQIAACTDVIFANGFDG